jgi:peptide/nickel transport system ATP-binding protein
MPRLNAIPTGCPFHPRCPEAFDRCPRERPDLIPAPGSDAACWLWDERKPRSRTARSASFETHPAGAPQDEVRF